MDNKKKKTAKRKNVSADKHLSYEIAWHIGAIAHSYEHISLLNKIWQSPWKRK